MALSRAGESNRCSRGFTLVETVISLAVLAILLMAAMNLLGRTYRTDATARDREIAGGLAHELMAEVMQTRYREPDAETSSFGPEPDETGGRSTFDDVDDYAGWIEDPPTRRDGSTHSGGAGFVRRVDVAYVPVSDVDAVGSTDVLDDAGLLRVTVTVTRTGGGSTVIQGLRSVHGSLDQEPEVESTVVRSIGVRLCIGEHGATMTSATPILNQVAVELGP